MSDRPPKPNELDPPASAEEIAEAERLRDALGSDRSTSEDAALLGSLRAAWSPGELDDAAHAAMLDDLPASAEELERAAALRDALERGSEASDDASLLVALRAAHAPTEIDENEHHLIVERALVQVLPPLASLATLVHEAKVVPLRPRRTLVAATTTLLALAAGVVLWMNATSSAEVPLAKARSTQPLFEEPFKPGEASARIDRIALARSADYRENRFAKWGVR